MGTPAPEKKKENIVVRISVVQTEGIPFIEALPKLKDIPELLMDLFCPAKPIPTIKMESKDVNGGKEIVAIMDFEFDSVDDKELIEKMLKECQDDTDEFYQDKAAVEADLAAKAGGEAKL